MTTTSSTSHHSASPYTADDRQSSDNACLQTAPPWSLGSLQCLSTVQGTGDWRGCTQDQGETRILGIMGGTTTLGNTAPPSHHSPPFLLPTPRDRPSLRPLTLALTEMCNWSPTHKTSSGGAPVKENGYPTGEDMWAFSNPFVTVISA